MRIVRLLFWLLVGVALSLALAGTARAETGKSFPWILTPDPLEWDYVSSEDIPFHHGSGAYTVRIYETKTEGRMDRFIGYTLNDDMDFPPRFGIWSRTDASGGSKAAFYMRAPESLAKLMTDVAEIATLVEVNGTGDRYMPQGLYGKMFDRFVQTGELPGADDHELAHHH